MTQKVYVFICVEIDVFVVGELQAPGLHNLECTGHVPVPSTVNVV
jgi:hypothetical protein